jgi:MFS transporter, DHA3 family, tetracycline resistance protein
MRKPNAYQIYLLMSAVAAFAGSMAWTNTPVYFVQVVRMIPLQLVLVGTVLEVTAFLFEIPTGVVADRYSRRTSVIIGQFLLGAGSLVVGAFPSFGAVLVGQVISGIGYTFISGALDAWIADELGTADIGPVYARASQAGTIGALAGVAASSGLALVQLQLPILLAGGLLIALGLVLIALMPEHGFKPAPHDGRSSWQAMGHTFMQGARLVRGSPLLLTLMAIAVSFGAFTEGLDRLWEAHFLTNVGLPLLPAVVWFGAISIAGMLFSLAGAEFVRRRVDMSMRANTGRTLLMTEGLLAAGVITFGLAASFPVALASRWLITLMRSISGPIYSTWLNQNIRSDVRATVLSMNAQSDALGQMLGGPGVGAIGSLFSIRAALVVSGLLLTPALALYARTARRGAIALERVPVVEPAEP